VDESVVAHVLGMMARTVSGLKVCVFFFVVCVQPFLKSPVYCGFIW
jgi:hypothetical protein